jgi:homoserine O-succinyltransferase
MPLIVDGERIPPLWAEKMAAQAAESDHRGDGHAGCVTIALINNMPDSALEDTEFQFFHLLHTAAGAIPVRIKLYSLPEVLRNDRAKQHVSNFYRCIEDLWGSQFDGAIITGTEPRQPSLRDEPYWSTLTDVFDWAERNTFSTVLSCLAAHAAVLHGDGIERHPLHDKQFGVFACGKTGEYALTAGTADLVRFPHSRWNEVREDELTACGYAVLTKSVESGVDLFVKRKMKGLFVHFQGHPEYGHSTLLKEYRRDIRRFLRQERETYPNMPRGYFGMEATEKLTTFQNNALSNRREESMALFPEAEIANTLASTWQASSTCIYRNWLEYILVRKAHIPSFAAMAQAEHARSPRPITK